MKATAWTTPFKKLMKFMYVNFECRNCVTTRAAGERFLHARVRRALSQCLFLLYDIEVIWRKTMKQAFSMF